MLSMLKVCFKREGLSVVYKDYLKHLLKSQLPNIVRISKTRVKPRRFTTFF